MLKILVAMLLLFPLSAKADWEFAKWGMSYEEVIRASRGTAIPFPPDQVRANSDFVGETALAHVPNRTIAGFPFDVRLTFDGQRRLVGVVLANDEGRFVQIKNALISQFGQPVSQEGGRLASVTWADTQRNNSVKMLSLGAATLVHYTKPATGF